MLHLKHNYAFDIDHGSQINRKLELDKFTQQAKQCVLVFCTYIIQWCKYITGRWTLEALLPPMGLEFVEKV